MLFIPTKGAHMGDLLSLLMLLAVLLIAAIAAVFILIISISTTAVYVVLYLIVAPIRGLVNLIVHRPRRAAPR